MQSNEGSSVLLVAHRKRFTALDAIREARAELLVTHGSCCASTSSLVLATARRIVETAPLEVETRTQLREELSELTSGL